MTHKDKMRAYMAANMYRVMDELGWSRYKYTILKYAYGEAYLRASLKADEKTIVLLSSKREFWNWWKLQWYIRENDFFMCIADEQLNTQQMRCLYHLMNDPVMLATDMSSYGKVMEESYARDLVPVLNKT